MYVDNNMSITDELTGMLGIQGFHQALEGKLRSGQQIALVMMDLDHFKAFNDRYGHEAGDDYLKTVGDLFRAAFDGEGHLAARYQGDEYAAALPIDDATDVYVMAEKLRKLGEKDGLSVMINGEAVNPGVTFSLGIAVYPANASNTEELIEKARQAVRRAKIGGGNRVYFYQETDPLTGLLNRGAILRALDEALARARAAGEPLSIFLLDIDRFKEINDEYGHRAGDQVLGRLAKILENNFNGVGVVGRTGGDEFLVLLPEHRADSAFILAEEVRRLVEDSEISVAIGDHSYALHFHLSGGIATHPGDASEQVDLLRKADEALFRSKRSGRNRISLPASTQMVTKTSHYTQIQLERLAELARQMDKTEAFLLREALDELLKKYLEGGK